MLHYYKSFFFSLFTLLIYSCTYAYAQEGQISLTIPDDTTITRGTSFIIHIDVQSQVPVKELGVITPIGRVIKISDNNFQIEAPVTIPLGPWNLYAYALLENGQSLETDQVNIQIEPELQFQSLELELIQNWFNYIGEISEFNVFGILSSGEKINLQGSSRLSFRSLDTLIAEVIELETEYVQITGHGETVIEATYTDPNTSLTLTAQASVGHNIHQRGDIDTSTGIESGDFQTVEEAVDEGNGCFTVRTPGDERDLNKDGFVDVKDLEEISLLCDHLNCSYIPILDGEPTPTPIIVIGDGTRQPCNTDPTPPNNDDDTVDPPEPEDTGTYPPTPTIEIEKNKKCKQLKRKLKRLKKKFRKSSKKRLQIRKRIRKTKRKLRRCKKKLI